MEWSTAELYLGNREIHDEKIIATLKPVIRIATADDDKIQANNKDKEQRSIWNLS